MINSVIKGTGKYIPSRIVKNKEFLNNEFYDTSGKKFKYTNQEILDKFEKITDIKERRYVTNDLVASDIGFYAAKEAIGSSGIDKKALIVLLWPITSEI